ncbi:MAG: DNA polymerase I [Candidatus Rokubacteria bacterium GWC2_70_24]|nr:MAG: DNA polymerase I [Candidatus Rokubacteria bacterium GWC2_70_24]
MGAEAREVPPVTERFFVLDGPGYLYRAYHALPFLSTSKGQPCHAVLGMSTMVWKLLREESPDYFIVAWDPPGPTFREERFAAYKETRPRMPDDLRSQIPYVKALFEALRLPLVEVPGFEADDVLGSLVARTQELPLELVLVSSDKDMLQLVGPRVRVLSAGPRGERVLLDEGQVREKWGVEPAQIPDLLALMGDSIDNIPGVPGVGQKTAVRLIGQFGSVERLYDNLTLVPGKLRETLAANRKQALLSRELATVRASVPLSEDLATFRRQEPDWERLRALWSELELHTLLRQLPEEASAAVLDDEPALASPEALADYLARMPAGEPLAVDWVGQGGPPEPEVTALGLFHPAAGRARLALAALPDLGGRALIGHDLKPVLEWWLARGAAPPSIEDTAVAAYLLNPARTNYRLEEVCAEIVGEGPGLARPGARAQWVWRLWEGERPALDTAGLRALYEEIERPLVPVLAAMERHGIRVDPDRLIEFSRELERSLDALTREIHVLAGEEFNLSSPKQLAVILFEKLKLPPVKKTKTGYSTDADVLEHLALGHPLPARLIEHRTLAKLKSTYADALPTLINPRTGRIHTSFNQLVAATGRLSSSNPNVQNIPIRTELGRRIRAAFVPEPGWRFVAADYSQIELRILAHVSGEESLVEAFRRGEDIHRRTASEVFGVPLDAVTSEQRDVAKTTNFSVIYGVTAFGLSRGLAISQKEAQEFLDRFFTRHPKVKAYLERTVVEGRERGWVATLTGRRRYLPELRSGNPNLRGFAERMATNAPIQGTAADLIKIAMVRLHRALGERGLRSRMLLQVHDELLFEAPEDEVLPLEALAAELMESSMTLAVPLKVDIKAGTDWAQV